MQKKILLIVSIAFLGLSTITNAQQNVGIGTTTPNSKSILELVSTTQGFLMPRMTTTQRLAIATVAADRGLVVYDTDLGRVCTWTGAAWDTGGGGLTGSGTATQIAFWNGATSLTSSSNLYWDNTNSRLGIGAAAPSFILDISGTSGPRTRITSLDNFWAGYLAQNNNRQYFMGVQGAFEAADGTNSGFHIYDNTASQQRLVIDYLGRMGINNFAPTERLDVGGNVKFSGALMPNNLAGASGQVLTSQGPSNAPIWSNSASTNIYNSDGTLTNNRLVTLGSNTLNFTTSSIGGFSVNSGAAFSVDGANNRVGIGNSTPRAPLDVRGVSSAPVLSNINLANNSNGATRFSFTGGDVIDFGFTSSGQFVGWIQAGYNGTAEPIVLSPLGGGVGIGTLFPSQALDVVGNIQFNGALMPNSTAGTSGQVLTSQGPGIAPTWQTPSTLPTGTSGQTLRHNGSGWLANSLLFNNGTDIGIGTTTPAARLEVVGAGVSNNVATRITSYSNTASADYPFLTLARVNNNTIGTNTALTSNQGLGAIAFAGSNGSSIQNSAQIISFATQNWSGAGRGANLGFYTTQNNSTTSNLRMVIAENGWVGIGGILTPLTLFTVGDNNQFRVNTQGNIIRVNDVPYSWPNAQGAAGTILTNDGSGNLSWAVASGGLPAGINGQTLRHDGTNWVANNFLYNNGTRIGIGTTTPNQLLELVGPENSGIDVITGSLTYRQSVNTSTGAQLGTVSGHNLNIFTSNQNRITVLSGGNVGIGTTTPGERLDVNGNIRLLRSGTRTIYAENATADGEWGSVLTLRAGHAAGFGGSAAGGGELDIIGGNQYDGADNVSGGNINLRGGINTLGSLGANDGNIKIFTNGTERMRVAGNNGYVGIGTTNPGAGLEVSGASMWQSAIGINNSGGGNDWRIGSDTDGFLKFVKITGTTNTPLALGPTRVQINNELLLFGSGVGTPGQVLTSQGSGVPPSWQNLPTGLGGTGSVNKIAFWNGINNLTFNSNFHWDNTNERLGIGWGIPVTKLHLHVATNTDPVYSNYTNVNTQIASTDGFWVGIDVPGNAELRQKENLNMNFFTNDIQRMTINNSGFVGINRTNPLAQTEIFGNASAATLASLNNTVASQGSQRLSYNSGDVFDFGFQTSPQYAAWMQAGFGGFGEAILLNPVGGNVGIGNTSPNSLLTVGTNGEFQVSSNGDISRIRNINYSWPGGNSAGVLTNDGAGSLTWATISGLSGGTINYMPKWTSANTLSSTSLIYDNGTNIGIGTASPSYPLDVRNVNAIIQAKATTGMSAIIIDKGNNADNGYMIFRSLGSDYWTFGQQNNLNLTLHNWANTRTDLTVLNTNGYIGMGTTSPGAKLQIQGSNAGVTGEVLQIYNTSTASSAKNTVNIGDDRVGTWGLLIGKSGLSTTASNYHGPDHAHIINVQPGSLHLGTNNTSRVTINNAGNVGIGTNAPTDRLSIAGVTNLNQGGTGVALRVNSAEALWYNGTYFSWGFAGNNFFDKNVGIGSTSFSRKFEVNSAANWNNTRLSSTTNGVALEFVSSVADDWLIGSWFGNFYFTYSNNDFGSQSDQFMMTTSAFRPVVDNNKSLGLAGARWTTVFATNGVINTSDRRHKENIQPLNYGLNDLMKLQPVSYTWKNDENKEVKLGLIAQDVENVIKEVVKKYDVNEPEFTDDRKGGKMKNPNFKPDVKDVYGIYYNDLIPVLIKSTQEQQQLIETLQSENADLKAKYEAQQKQIDELMKLIRKQ
jgi:hypothetical protein